MERDEYKRIYEEFRNADEKYRDYVEQFFTRMGEGKITKKTTKMLNREELKKIQDLREKANIARKGIDDFFGIKPEQKTWRTSTLPK